MTIGYKLREMTFYISNTFSDLFFKPTIESMHLRQRCTIDECLFMSYKLNDLNEKYSNCVQNVLLNLLVRASTQN